MKQKLVIIGVSYSSRLALARAVGVLDCDITIIAWGIPGKVGKPIDGYSKYVSRCLICPKEEIAFIDLLKTQCADLKQKVVLIPDCDFSVTMIDSHMDELRPYFLIPNIKNLQGEIVKWSDKTKQKQLASSLGMNVAYASIIDMVDGQYTIPKDIHYPCFPKAIASVAGGKAGMWRCDNQKDLEQSLHDIVNRKTSTTKVLVEDYKEIDKEYAVLGFSDGNNVCIPGVIQFIAGSKTQKGIALQGKIIPITGFEGIIGQFKSFIKEIGLFGLFDIDFYESGGRLYFSELNIRYGGSGYAVVKMGVNIPAMYVESLVRKKEEDFDKRIESSAVFTNERMCFNDLNNGLMTPCVYNHYIRTSDILFIKDEDDRAPFKVFQKTVFKAKLKYWPNKVIRWIKR